MHEVSTRGCVKVVEDLGTSFVQVVGLYEQSTDREVYGLKLYESYTSPPSILNTGYTCAITLVKTSYTRFTQALLIQLNYIEGINL